ncbi:hypothetical protein [Sporisorium scitamineum]|uniref:Uncharacterized protein n=1 Tax=Sporisorium scitamineum TaxID=49012 RepID=A0A0F7S2L7_9BASI|nr:hypothetical protein [Sporisorium scitamineum]
MTRAAAAIKTTRAARPTPRQRSNLRYVLRAPKYLGGTVEQTALVMLFSSFSAGGKGFEKTYSCL